MSGEQELVRVGYDRIAKAYAAETQEGRTEATYYRAFLARCVERLPANGSVLDLGCGAGIVAEVLAGRTRVLGIDLSSEQLHLASARVPGALFAQADMTNLELRDRSLDAVAAFWSIIHVPRHLHAELFVRIHRWMRPGGLFFGTLGSGDNPDERQSDFFGAPMYWSHFDAATNRELLSAAGFAIEESDVVEDMDERHLWVIATA